MNLSKIREFIIQKAPQFSKQISKQALLETPKKTKVFNDRESTIDRTQNHQIRNSENYSIKSRKNSRKYIKLMQIVQKNSPKNKPAQSPAKQLRKILKVQEIHQLHLTKEDQQKSRSKSKKKLCLTDSTLKFVKPETKIVVNQGNSDLTGCQSVSELMSKKTKKLNKKVERFDTPINLITEQNYQYGRTSKLA